MKYILIMLLMSCLFVACFDGKSDSLTSSSAGKAGIMVVGSAGDDTVGSILLMFHSLPSPYPEVTVNGEQVFLPEGLPYGAFYNAFGVPVGQDVPYTVKSGDDVLAGSIYIPKRTTGIRVNGVPVSLFQSSQLANPLERIFTFEWDSVERAISYRGSCYWMFRRGNSFDPSNPLSDLIWGDTSFNELTATSFQLNLSFIDAIPNKPFSDSLEEMTFYVEAAGYPKLKGGELPNHTSATMFSYNVSEGSVAEVTLE